MPPYLDRTKFLYSFYLCFVCICGVCLCSCVCKYACGGQKSMSFIALHFIFWGGMCLTETEAHQLSRLAGQWAPKTCCPQLPLPPCSQNSGYRHVVPHPASMWVLEICTQVQVCPALTLPTAPSSQPVCVFEKGFHCVAQSCTELMIPLPPPLFRIIGLCHHTWLCIFFINILPVSKNNSTAKCTLRELEV